VKDKRVYNIPPNRHDSAGTGQRDIYVFVPTRRVKSIPSRIESQTKERGLRWDRRHLAATRPTARSVAAAGLLVGEDGGRRK